MSRGFSSADRLVAASAAVTSYPVTLAVWFRLSTLFLNQSVLALGTSGASDASVFALRISSSNTLQARSTDAAGSTSSATAAGTVALDTWTHGAVVFISNTSRIAYMNGAGTSNSATRTVDPSTFAYSTIACNPTTAGGNGAFLAGDIAEPAWWNAELTADEIAMLAAGYSPLFVRPGALRAYTPLSGRSGSSGDEEDWVGGLSFVQTGSPTVIDHPRIIYPKRRPIVSVAAAAAATYTMTSAGYVPGSLTSTSVTPRIVRTKA